MSLEDSIFNPFEKETDQSSYLQPEAVEAVKTPVIDSYLTNELYVHEEVMLHKRVRYNFWDLLTDAGGLYDGMSLLILIFVNPISSNRFQLDLIAQDRKRARLS